MSVIYDTHLLYINVFLGTCFKHPDPHRLAKAHGIPRFHLPLGGVVALVPN